MDDDFTSIDTSGVGRCVAAPGTVSLALGAHEEDAIIAPRYGFLDVIFRVAITSAVVRLIAHERAELHDRIGIASIIDDERDVNFVQRVAGRPEPD